MKFGTQWLIGALALITATSPLLARSAGAPERHSGAPGDTTCTQCHTTNPQVNSGPGNVTIKFSDGTTYTPGQTQKVTVTITDPNARRWGFQASHRIASDAANKGAGTVSPSDDNTHVIATIDTLQWITHTSAGTRPGTTGPTNFEFNWTAPSTDVGPVDFYVAANAANNNNNNQGDFIYTTKATLTPAGATSQKPAISSGGVVNGANPKAGVVSGSWFTIFGQNFTTSTRTWRNDEIVNGVLPTSLDGVSVTVNGKPAAIYYISPGQINAQAPDDTSTGTVAVVVKNAAGESTPEMVNLQQFSPACFQFDTKYIAAVAADGSLLGPSGLLGANVATRPAKPGETILIFGTGFGPTNPGVPAGRIFQGAANLANNVRITIGGVQSDLAFAGLSGAGLYQFNVTVPSTVADGDQPVAASVGGVDSQAGSLLSVRRQ
jgi:uncharacterized protein (TIGR03437 family)